MDRVESLWAALRAHPAFRVGAVYVGAAWVLVQAAEIFGFSTGTIRALGGLLALGFLLLDYMTLLKKDGEWRIVNKSFHAERKGK